MLAGTVGLSGYANGAGSEAQFNFPNAIAADSQGKFAVSDFGNNLIRRIDSSGSRLLSQHSTICYLTIFCIILIQAW